MLMPIEMNRFSSSFFNSYFFYVLSALVLIGLVNGLFFLPILLSLVGPPAEVIPADREDRIATPTPEPSPCMERCSRGRGDSIGGSSKIHRGGESSFISSSSSSSSSNNYHHHHNNNNNNNPSVTYVPRRLRGSDLSLTTITEEPPSWTSSHEIVVQPEVVVETTTWNGDGSCNSSRHSSDQVKSHLTAESPIRITRLIG